MGYIVQKILNKSVYWSHHGTRYMPGINAAANRRKIDRRRRLEVQQPSEMYESVYDAIGSFQKRSPAMVVGKSDSVGCSASPNNPPALSVNRGKCGRR